MALPTPATDPNSVLMNLEYAVGQVNQYIQGISNLTTMTTNPTSFDVASGSVPAFNVADTNSVAAIQTILQAELSGFNIAYIALVNELISYGQAVLATLET